MRECRYVSGCKDRSSAEGGDPDGLVADSCIRSEEGAFVDEVVIQFFGIEFLENVYVLLDVGG